jgi:uncharacterized membrane protein
MAADEARLISALETVPPGPHENDLTAPTAVLDQAGEGWQALTRHLEASEGLDRPQPAIRSVAERIPPPARRVLRGDWLGHSLHPALTDLPIGFWTSAFVLDLVPSRRVARTSTAMVGLGLASAVPTIAAGLVDWVELPKDKRRVGVVHLVANTAATIAYTASLAARLRGRRGKGVLLGMAGATLATAGGALGGHLAFGSSDGD